MGFLYDPTAPKKSANLSLNSDLLQQAKALNINLSQACEQGLAEIVKQRKQERWLAESQAAIAAYNAHIEQDGVFSDDLRSF